MRSRGGGSQEDMIDNFYFSTCQTASLKNLTEKLPYVDIIIVDEGHNVWRGNEFETVLKNLSAKWRDGNPPHIIAITATPSNITTELFGDPIFQFGLAAYLASPYSPRVEYKLITSTTASPEEITSLSRRIDSAKSITDIPEKKRTIREIEEQFDALMAKYPDTESLVWDILHRITTEDPSGRIWPTIVFVSSIDEADRVTRTINTRTGSDIALAYHSGSRTNDALGRLADPSDSTRFVIAVDMLNESIDLPTVENIVFWRGTNMARIYLQQFGRWLRWDGVVRYYDYVGGMQNFAWIDGIYTEYKLRTPMAPIEPIEWPIVSMEPVVPVSVEPVFITPADPIEPTEPQPPTILPIDPPLPIVIIPTPPREPKLVITTWHIDTSLHDVDLGALGFSIRDLQEDIIELSQDDVRQYFRENGTLEEWMKKTHKERSNLNIKGYGIKKIARIFEVWENHINTDLWYELLAIIFTRKIDASTLDEVKRRDIRQYFRENGTLEDWKGMNARKRKNLKIEWYGLIRVATIFGIKKNPVVHKDIWHLLLGEIFDIEIELRERTGVWLEDIRRYFIEKGTLEEWKKKTTIERRAIKIQECGLVKIARIFKIEWDPGNTIESWHNLLWVIFETQVEKTELTKDDIVQYFKNNGTLEEWAKMVAKERLMLKINNYGHKKISKIMCWDENSIKITDKWHSLLWVIFETQIEKTELTKDDIVQYFKNNGTLEEWKNIAQRERAWLKIWTCGIVRVAGLFNVDENPVGYTEWWYTLLEKIFSQEITRSQLNPKIISDFFKEKPSDYWLVLDRKERQDLKISNYGLVRIAWILGITWDPIGHIDVWRSMIGDIFWVDTRKVSLTKLEVTTFFKGHWTLEEWKNKTAIERRDIKIRWYGLGNISRTFHIDWKPNIHTQTWHTLLDAIFSEETKQ
jgi:hypothetical protein